MAQPTVNAPGAGGYLLAWALTNLLFAGGIVGSMLAAEEDWALADFLGWLVLVGTYTTIASVPFAVPGILLVHVMCRDVPEQRVHVLGAACSGAMAGGVLALLSGGLIILAPALAACAALGRAAVIPLVHERRRHDSRSSAGRC